MGHCIPVTLTYIIHSGLNMSFTLWTWILFLFASHSHKATVIILVYLVVEIIKLLDMVTQHCLMYKLHYSSPQIA